MLQPAVPLLLALAANAPVAGVITRIDQALRLSPEEAASGRPVHLRGVVSYADPVTRDFFVQQDDGTGISLWYPDPAQKLTQGDLIELEGKTERGDYAPKIALPLTRLEVLAHGQRVTATVPTQAQLAADGLDCRHVVLDAVVRDVLQHGAQTELRIASLLGPARVLFATGVRLEELASLVGAEIRVRVTVGVDLNQAQQRVGLRLYAQSRDSVEVLRPSQPVSALMRRELGELLRFQRTQQSDARVVTGGNVIYAAGKKVFIAAGESVARLRLAESELAHPLPALGTRLEVAGFVEPGEPFPQMIDARVLSATADAEPAPVVVTGQELVQGGLEDRLVRVEGRVSSLLLRPVQLLSLETRAGPALAMALEPHLLPAEGLPVGTEVEAVGINSRALDKATPVVLLRRPEDLRVLRPRPFWTPGRLVLLAGGAVLLAAAMLLRSAVSNARARELQRLVDARTAALSLANRALEERSVVLEGQQRELVELHHVRARFIATVAHDLRTPLMIVLASADRISVETDPRRVAALAGEIAEAAEHVNDELTRVVRSYRDERQLLRSERFDVAAVVKSAAESARPVMDRKRQQLTLALPEHPVWVVGDSAIFGHVVLNLLSNASKFSGEGTRVGVTVSADAPQVRVRDQGPGLDARDLARLFDHAQRPGVRPTAKESSTGEGLLLSERWMRTMGGTISCQSTVGEGSTFLLSLPAAEAPERG